MRVLDLFELTLPELNAALKDAPADTQATGRFLSSRIIDKKGGELIRFAEREGATEVLREPYERLHPLPVASIGDRLKQRFKLLTIAELAVAMFILECVKSGQPIRIEFPEKREASGRSLELVNDDAEWLRDQVRALTDEYILLNVSDWAEEKRYLPKQVTSMPGYYSYEVTPFLREIADCLSQHSPVRFIDFMKGAQIGATVGILENAIGYIIEHLGDAPAMLLTADSELAKLRVDKYITPMLQHSGLLDLIQSNDETNTRKTGKTSSSLEWQGGGYLMPFGARNADKLRSSSIRYLLQDEVDAFPERVGKDGDPQKLAEARTKAYRDTRKVARISTPLIKGSSRIERGFKKGDQRRFYVPCKHCGLMQVLRFSGKNDETGKRYGLKWSLTPTGQLDIDSVRYVCKGCGGEHINSDKTAMLAAGEWRASVHDAPREHRSYHLSALYSPVGMYTWGDIVGDWLDAWDVERNQPKSLELLQEFYNGNLGEPFEQIGVKVSFAAVSHHRRSAYKSGEIPTVWAQRYADDILFLTCQVDVHKTVLYVGVFGWTAGARCFVIEYLKIKGRDCSQSSDKAWGELQAVIEEKVWVSDDGRSYRPVITLIDAGYSNSTVVEFCSQYASNVYPIVGRDRPSKNQTIKEFAKFETVLKTTGFRIIVDHYKDRLAPVLRREWIPDIHDRQPPYHFNAPVDLPDSAIKELTNEVRREERDSNGRARYYWHREGKAPNELWDLLCYGHAAVEILAWEICIQHFALEGVDWPKFWEYLKESELYFERAGG